MIIEQPANSLMVQLSSGCEKLSSGWWYTYPSEKYYIVSWGYFFPIYGKIKHVPNHQPVITACCRSPHVKSPWELPGSGPHVAASAATSALQRSARPTETSPAPSDALRRQSVPRSRWPARRHGIHSTCTLDGFNGSNGALTLHDKMKN